MTGQDYTFLAGTALAVIITFLMVHTPSRRFLETWVAHVQITFLSPVPNDDGPEVSAIYIYPVKSLQRVAVESVNIDSLGLVGDRRFMLVVPSPAPTYACLPHDPTHKFVTQRQCPILATISAQLQGDSLTLSCGNDAITITKSTWKGNPKFRARIWSDVVAVQDVGDEVAAFLQTIITAEEGDGVRLVTIAGIRTTDDKYIPPEARTWTGETPLTSLNDGFPILIACEASLNEVNRRLKEKGKEEIPMSRFRPNIVIKNTQPFVEDTWKIIQIGDTILHLVKGCPRCKQSCTDQETGKVSDEPVNILGEFRALGKSPDEVYFAQNAIAYGKSVSVGTTIKVLKLGTPVWEIETLQGE